MSAVIERPSPRSPVLGLTESQIATMLHQARRLQLDIVNPDRAMADELRALGIMPPLAGKAGGTGEVVVPLRPRGPTRE